MGNALKSIGDIPGAVGAFRRAVAIAPGYGEGWWSLVNLKSFRFDAADLAAMEEQAARAGLDDADHIPLDFALGKAREDAHDHETAFAWLAAGNRRQLARAGHDPAYLPTLTRRSAALFTTDFFAERAGYDDPSPDPIFIVGIPRSGSTLVEQILASHPDVEGTMELPVLPRIVRELGGLRADPATAPYPDTLARLPRDQFAAIDARYLRRAGDWRQDNGTGGGSSSTSCR